MIGLDDRKLVADTFARKIPAHFDDFDRGVIDDLIHLVDRCQSDQQVVALVGAIACSIEKMARSYIEVRPGVYRKMLPKKAA